MNVPTGVLLGPRMEPGTEAWLQTMSASKIAAVVGLSTYESRFSLWHRMAGLIDPEPDDDEKRRGHYLEPSIAAWFADQHPEWFIERTGTWGHPDRRWQTASPDRLVHRSVDRPTDIALLELKSAATTDEWGDPGTDEIPVGYRAQVMWQMDTLGIHTCHVAVLSAYLEFAEYVVHYDPDEAAYLRDAARRFMDSLPGGPHERRPSLDGATVTYQAVRQLHPDIEPIDVDIDERLAAEYRQALDDFKRAEAEKSRLTAEVADAIGTGRRAVITNPNGKAEPVAVRVPGRGDNPPFLRPSPVKRTTTRIPTTEKSAAA